MIEAGGFGISLALLLNNFINLRNFFSLMRWLFWGGVNNP